MTKIKKHLSYAGRKFPARALWKSRNAVMGFSVMVLIAACHKDNVQPEAVQAPQEDQKTEQLTKYLSVVLGVDQNKIIYDQTKDEFQMENSDFRMERKTVASYYADANEYKSKYETKK